MIEARSSEVLHRATTATVERVSTLEYLRGLLREALLYLFVLLGWLISMRAIYERLVVEQPGIRPSIPTVTLLVATLPLLFMAVLVFLVDNSISPRWGFSLSLSSETTGPRSSRSSNIETAFVEEAVEFWDHERQQVDALRWRFRVHGIVFGLVAGLTISFPIIIAPDVLVHPAEALREAGTWKAASVTVASAAIVCFLQSFARMLVRAANRDSSTQMFAWSTKRMVVVASASTLLSCLEGIDGLNAQLFHSGLGYVLMGAGIAILGDRGALAVTERVGRALGAAQPGRQPGAELALLDGIEEEDAQRLLEEGIDSIHALAFYSTPKLFFNTPYALVRICDWQDQALLFAELGTASARAFREQLSIRGAADARSLVCEVSTAPQEDSRKEDLCKILGFTSLKLDGVRRRLEGDDTSRRLLVYRLASPVQEARLFVRSEDSESSVTANPIRKEIASHVARG